MRDFETRHALATSRSLQGALTPILDPQAKSVYVGMDLKPVVKVTDARGEYYTHVFALDVDERYGTLSPKTDLAKHDLFETYFASLNGLESRASITAEHVKALNALEGVEFVEAYVRFVGCCDESPEMFIVFRVNRQRWPHLTQYAVEAAARDSASPAT